MKKEHRNKMIAPIIIAAVLIVYYVAICSNRRTCAGDKEWRRR